MAFTLEIKYVSMARKAKTGKLIVRDEKGEYVGEVYDRPDVRALFSLATNDCAACADGDHSACDCGPSCQA